MAKDEMVLAKEEMVVAHLSQLFVTMCIKTLLILMPSSGVRVPSPFCVPAATFLTHPESRIQKRLS